jgi:hypothetical protein
MNSGYYDFYNTQAPYIGLDPGTQGHSTCDLFSYAYLVFNAEGDTMGWYPARPDSLAWKYGVLIQGGSSGIEGADPEGSGKWLRILSAAPNPVKRVVEISLEMPSAGHVKVSIYNARGQIVRNVADKLLDDGVHRVEWDGRNDQGRGVGPGVYFCRVSTVKQSDVKKLVLLREGGY